MLKSVLSVKGIRRFQARGLGLCAHGTAWVFVDERDDGGSVASLAANKVPFLYGDWGKKACGLLFLFVCCDCLMVVVVNSLGGAKMKVLVQYKSRVRFVVPGITGITTWLIEIVDLGSLCGRHTENRLDPLASIFRFEEVHGISFIDIPKFTM